MQNGHETRPEVLMLCNLQSSAIWERICVTLGSLSMGYRTSVSATAVFHIIITTSLYGNVKFTGRSEC